jgi:ribosomal protein S18 acetylase RimI-like enzyme
VPGEVRLRPATKEEAARLKQLVRSAYGHYVERIGWEPRPMTEDYSEVMTRFDVLVAESGGEIVGLIVIGPDEEGFVVDNVAVDPASQGSGVGRLLLERAEEAARAAGFDSIYLYTHDSMTKNIALYRRIGYVEYDRRPVPNFDSEVVYMRKRLGPAGAD